MIVRWPFIRTQKTEPQRQQKELDVTIAAGFRFSDGILLCADTQHTYPGAMKLQASKIVSCDLAAKGGGQYVFAICGSVPYAHMAIEHCLRAIRARKPKERTGGGIRLELEDAIEGFHQKHIYQHPAFHQGGGPDFQLLIAVRSDLDKTTAMYVTNDSAVTEVPDYECVGAGSFLAHYLVPTLFRHRQMALTDTANIAIHVLRETKDYVEACGGGSVFIALRNNGEVSPIASWDISSQESFSRGFRSAIERIYVFAADLKSSPERVHEEFKLAETIIQGLRNTQQANKKKWDAFYGELEKVQKTHFKQSISEK